MQLTDLMLADIVISAAALWAAVCAWWRALRAEQAAEDSKRVRRTSREHVI